MSGPQVVERVGPIPQAVIWPAALVLLAGVGVADFYTGAELSFSIFYLIPVALGAWYGGRNRGLLMAVLAALTWWAADQVGGAAYSHAWIPMWNAAVRLGFFAIVAALLARLRIALDRERRWASIDHLSGLANTRAFYQAADMERRRAGRVPRAFTVAYLDLDNFKTVNDQWGHAAGDDLLRKIATILKTHLRATDLAARLGGDEFALLLPETDYAAAGIAIEKVVTLMNEAMQAEGWPVTASVGAVTFGVAPPSVDDLVAAADRLMYAVKRGGKNAVRHEYISDATTDG